MKMKTGSARIPPTADVRNIAQRVDPPLQAVNGESTKIERGLAFEPQDSVF